MAAKKLPYLNLFISDYVKDTRILSLETRAIWMDMLCLMHDGDRRGYLSRNDQPLGVEYVANFCGCSIAQVTRATRELLSTGVASSTGTGVLYSRRMVRDEEERLFYAVYGKHGGNPSLMGRDNPPDNAPLVVSNSNSLSGVGGAGGRGSDPSRPRSNLLSDNPNLAQAAKDVVKHYQAAVRSAHPAKASAAENVIGHIHAGRTPQQLKSAADAYAAHCKRHRTSQQHRQSAATFYADGGGCDEFVEKGAADYAAMTPEQIIDAVRDMTPPERLAVLQALPKEKVSAVHAARKEAGGNW